MKNLIWVCAALCVLSACSKQEEATAPVETPVAIDEAVAEADESATQVAETATQEVEVVEESAADVEPSDEAIKLAVAETPAAAREWKYKEGEHYVRMVPTQPTVGGADKIEVAEFFMYSCSHCYDLEPYINEWAKNKDPGVRFVRIPASWNALVKLHAQLYYTEEVLARNGILKDPEGFRETVFQEYHQRGNRMTSEAAIQKLFARFDVSEEDFQSTWGSFEVNQKLRVAADLARRYSITSVPAIVVNGKYRTSASETGTYPRLIETINELTVREGLR